PVACPSHTHHSVPTRRSSDLPASTQAGSARVAERLIGRGDPFIRAAELSQFDHKIRRLRYAPGRRGMPVTPITMQRYTARSPGGDRKSTRLNSSHQIISYAVL